MELGKLIVVSGFSGAGKSTVVTKMCKEYPYELSISATTRKPRIGEVDGREYFFISEEEFKARIEENDFLEWAQYVNHYYGTPLSYVQKMREQGKDVILEIEAQGAMKVKARIPETQLIFVVAPSMLELLNRLSTRGTESAEVVRKRLERTREEMKLAEVYDRFLINNTVDGSVYLLNRIIQEGLGYGPKDSNLLQEMEEELNELI